VLILGLQRLVVLETPKTGSLALRAMLAPYTLSASDEAARHTRYRGYLLHHAARLTEAFGGAIETVAVVRAPLDRMQSWYRYRMRPRVAHLPVSTRGMCFEDFISAYLDRTNREITDVGRQDRFVGWTGRAAGVDHVFDYNRLDLLEAFFSARTGDALELPVRNLSPLNGTINYGLSAALLARYQAENEQEFALYDAVAAKGHLVRAGVGQVPVSNSAR
jgi:hypothetical protein